MNSAGWPVVASTERHQPLGGVESLRVRGEQLDRDVDETLVQKADDHAGLAGHRGVDGVAREEIAEQRVLAVRGAAADLIAGVEVTHHDRDALGS